MHGSLGPFGLIVAMVTYVIGQSQILNITSPSFLKTHTKTARPGRLYDQAKDTAGTGTPEA